jgi:hypothetical protein
MVMPAHPGPEATHHGPGVDTRARSLQHFDIFKGSEPGRKPRTHRI